MTFNRQPVKPKSGNRFPIELTADRVIIGGSILASIFILLIIGLSSAKTGFDLNRPIEGVEYFPGMTASHQETTVNYQQNPPAGGAHHPRWQTCGVYTEPIRKEHAVHSLEHGAIWITYQPNLPADQVATLQNITRQSSHRLLSPYPGIDSPIVVSAWGYQLRLDNANDERLQHFIAKYEQGPSTPERGATCNGGETRTLSQLQQG
jgi:hypothetical protein